MVIFALSIILGSYYIALPSTGIDADAPKGETRPGYFGSKLV